MLYIAIKTDIVHSRKLKKRADFQNRFLNAVKRLNNTFSSSFASNFIVTHGDEAQGLVYTSHAKFLFLIIEELVDSMSIVKLRFGISIGTLSTKLQKDAIGMDGEVWQIAKEAINNANRSKQFINVRGFEESDQEMLEALANLLLLTRSKWSDEQKEAIYMLRQGKSQIETARELGVSEAAISKRLCAAGWRHYKSGVEAIKIFLPKAVANVGKRYP